MMLSSSGGCPREFSCGRRIETRVVHYLFRSSCFDLGIVAETRDGDERHGIVISATAVKGHWELLGGGHENCPVVAMGSARLATVRPVWSGQGLTPLPASGLGQADGVAGGLADVGVMKQPVDGGGGQGLGHQLVERCGVQVGEIAMERFS